MRRRTPPGDPAEIPPELLTRPGGPDEIAAFYGWFEAQKRWCAGRGLDYVDTFHPEWRQRA